ncbi:cysteine desulfurase NifS [Candidatus Micrarchaeota archaeon]|nr:MAG: cysteine desulfurase NifS [Candidatus Micrarchaeota archaeon]
MDNSATTRMLSEVVEAMQPHFTEKYGNPSSLHYMGIEAERAVDESRAKLAECINAEPYEIIFTGSATEANNLAIVGACHAGRKKIITSEIEHSSVGKVIRNMERRGFETVFIGVDEEGFVDLKELEKKVDGNTALVSIIHANHEIGTIQNLEAIGKMCKEKEVLFHSDASQSFTKVPIDVKKFGVDLLTLNSHKIHGPKGVGALYVRKEVKLEKQVHGGMQERNWRAGTENVAGMVGFAKAAEIGVREMKRNVAKMQKLRNALVEGLLRIENAQLNGPESDDKRLCNIANITFNYVEGEALLMRLSEQGICVSTGSACSSKSLQPSHVLKALGLKHEQAHGSLRFSLSKFNSSEEVNYVIKMVEKEVAELRKLSAYAPGKKAGYYEEREQAFE